MKGGFSIDTEYDENDVIEFIREGLSLITIKRVTGISIKILRQIKDDATQEGFLYDSDVDQKSELDGTLVMTLLARGKKVPARSGLNWGLANAHVSPNDAYIPIRIMHLRDGFFHDHGKIFDAEWDDGVRMRLITEGTQPLDGEGIYPKQLCSYPDKSVLGIYIRDRINTPAPIQITSEHLMTYGRTDISVSFRNPNILLIDFSSEN